jgi:hypothetical protein
MIGAAGCEYDTSEWISRALVLDRVLLCSFQLLQSQISSTCSMADAHDNLATKLVEIVLRWVTRIFHTLTITLHCFNQALLTV